MTITRFQTAKGSTYVVNADGTTTRNKAFRPEHGESEQGLQETSQRTIYLDSNGLDALREFQAKGASSKSLVLIQGGLVGIRYVSGPSMGKIERRSITPYLSAPAIGLTPVETWKEGRVVHFGNLITCVM